MIQSPPLAALGPVRHGFFTRQGGCSVGHFASLNCGYGSGDDKQTVARNRVIAAKELGVEPGALLTAWQWHSADVAVAHGVWDSHDPPRADAIVTSTPGLALGILTADCAPVLFADAKAGVVGAAHAGWKGAVSGVTDATLAAMENLGANRSRIIAVVGPTISQSNYEVGPEFRARFAAENSDNLRFFEESTHDGRCTFDLPGYLLARLAKGGIGQCHALRDCTYADEARFFSFRRSTRREESAYGRQISVIALAG